MSLIFSFNFKFFLVVEKTIIFSFLILSTNLFGN